MRENVRLQDEYTVRSTCRPGRPAMSHGDSEENLVKALVYHGPNQKSWEEVPDPKIIDPTDVIVQVDTTTICGTDLHILKGDVPAVTDGRILGHEGVGTIIEVGSGVAKFAVGDRVIISCITSCGSCSYCRQQLPSHCLNKEGTSGIGWIFGHLIDGTQAEYVRVPFAENSLHKLPAGVSDEAAVMLSDIIPTGFEIGVRNGKVQPGDVVAVVGAGPVGLSAMMTPGSTVRHASSPSTWTRTALLRRRPDPAIRTHTFASLFEMSIPAHRGCNNSVTLTFLTRHVWLRPSRGGQG